MFDGGDGGGGPVNDRRRRRSRRRTPTTIRRRHHHNHRVPHIARRQRIRAARRARDIRATSHPSNYNPATDTHNQSDYSTNSRATPSTCPPAPPSPKSSASPRIHRRRRRRSSHDRSRRRSRRRAPTTVRRRHHHDHRVPHIARRHRIRAARRARNIRTTRPRRITILPLIPITSRTIRPRPRRRRQRIPLLRRPRNRRPPRIHRRRPGHRAGGGSGRRAAPGAVTRGEDDVNRAARIARGKHVAAARRAWNVRAARAGRVAVLPLVAITSRAVQPGPRGRGESAANLSVPADRRGEHIDRREDRQGRQGAAGCAARCPS